MRLFAQLGQDRMPRGRDGDIRAYHRIRADIDMRVVHGGEIEISVYTVAQMHMRPAPVRVERRLEIAVLAYFSKHLFHQRLPFLLLSRARGIELVEQIELFELLVEYRLLVRIIELASVHSFIPMVFLLFCFLRFDYTLCARFFSLFCANARMFCDIRAFLLTLCASNIILYNRLV